MILKPVRGWRAFYAPDLWHCGHSAADAEDLPDDVLVLVTYETHDWAPKQPYRRVLCGADWYWWSGEFAGSLADFVEPATHPEPGKWLSPQPILDRFPGAILKKGIWDDNELYEATRLLAYKAVGTP